MINRRTTVAATSEPVTLSEAKAQLRVEHSDSDTEISAMITAARDAVEQYCNRYWARQTVAAEYPFFPLAGVPLRFDLPDVEEVTGLSYLDADYAVQTIAAGDLTLDAQRQQITYSGDWPTDGRQIVLTMDVGPDAAASPPDYVPQAIKHAILLYVTDLYENRSAQMPVSLYDNRAAMALMQPYRVNQGI